MVKPLENIRVISVTHALAGPFCIRILATLGAEVISISQPWGGYGATLLRDYPADIQRRVFGYLKTNTKGITLNLRSEKGKEIFLDLVRKADVVVHNMAPGVMEKLGLSYDVVKEANTRIIYCAISGYGQNGPWRDRVAYDPCIQAATGLMSITGYPDRRPVKVGASVSDCLAGLYGVIGILTGLHARDTITGKGQMIDCAMYDATISILLEPMITPNMTRMANRHPASIPAGAYGTKDGKLEFIAVQTDAQWEAFMKLLGREDIVAKKLPLAQRIKLADEVDNMTEEWTNTKTQQEIEEILNVIDIPFAPVMEAEEVKEHPQTVAREMFVTADDMYGKISGLIGVVPNLLDTPGSVERGTMPNNAFNEEVYAGLLGYSEEQLEKLKGEGVI
jgi:CoA:oxalate CoA-transferase